MKQTREQIEQAIAILEGQRAVLGPAVVDASIDALHRQLAELDTPAAQPVAQQRKQVTLLYTDVVGSTGIARHLDPEDVLEIMDGALKRLAVPVEAQGGHVTRYQGDGFKAVFGVPLAHEDDPEHAVRAGLGILETAQTIAAELQVKHNIEGFAVRVGINTGLVMVGGQTEAEDTIMGEAVILAARMESAAPPGGMLITYNTYQHITDLFEVHKLEPMQVKGFDQPVVVYQVLRARPRPFWKRPYHVAGVVTRMVGRDPELRRLQDAFQACAGDREPHMITLVGEPGIGKSRLLHEMTAWLDLLPDGALQEQGVTMLRGRPDQDMQQRPYALLRDLFAGRFDIQDNDTLPVLRWKFEQGVAAFGPYPEASGELRSQELRSQELRSHFIGQLLGFDFSDSPHLRGILETQSALQQIRHRAQVFLRELFIAVASRGPVALLLEDIHWADDPSLDLLNELLAGLSGQPFFVLATARPALFERRPHWGEGRADHTRLDLAPLSRRDSRKLVEGILQRIPHLPEALRELIVGNGEGNPFYLEELVKMMVEDGVIRPMEGDWQVDAARLAGVRVPPTLAAVLQARFDSLPEPERLALQRASVMGRIFWDESLIYLGGPGGCVTCGAALAALRGREMVFQRETSSLKGAQEYLFKHALLREATYQSVLKRDRRIYHAAAARWLIERSQDRQAEFAGQIAEHLVQAGQAQEAVDYLRRAGEAAAGQFANEQALAYFARALHLLPETETAARFDLLLARTRLLHRMGRHEDERAGVLKLETLAGSLGTEHRVQAAIQRAYAAERTETSTAHLAAATLAVNLAREAGRVDLEAEANLALGLAAAGGVDEHEIFLQALQRALTLSQQAGLRRLEPDIYKYLSHVYQNSNNNQAAFEAAQKGRQVSRALGDLYGEGRALAMMGNTLVEFGDITAAIQYERESQRVCREAGNLYDESHALMNLWTMYETLGMLEQKTELLREGIEAVIHHIHSYFQVVFYYHRAYDRLRASDPLGALEYALKGLAACPDRPEDVNWRAAMLAAKSEVLAAQGRDDEAQACLLSAFELNDGTPDVLRLITLMILVRYHTRRGTLQSIVPYVEELHQSDWARQSFWRGYNTNPAMLACYRAFRQLGDPRAREALEQAHQAVEAFSAAIADPEIRRSYRENLPWNHEILQEWALLV